MPALEASVFGSGGQWRRVAPDPVMAVAAGDLMKSGSQTVLLKGGRLRGKEVVDLQLQRGAEKMRMSSLRMEGRNIHGMGCTLSSAIACHPTLGHELAGAVRSPRSYAFQAIAQGADVQTGGGHGPLNHAHAPRPMQKLPNEGGLIIVRETSSVMPTHGGQPVNAGLFSNRRAGCRAAALPRFRPR